jgi:hypothetical protein
MDANTADKLSALLAASAKRDQALLRKLFKTFKVDWATGEVEVKRDAIRAAFPDDKTGANLARSFEYLVSDGFIVKRDAATLEGNVFPAPWRALADLPSVMTLDSTDWAYLGIRPKADPERVANTLNNSFVRVPDFMKDSTRLGGLIEIAGLPPRGGGIQLPGIGAGGWPGIGNPPTTLPTKPTTTPPAVNAKDVADIATLAAAAFQCLKDSPWSMDRNFFGIPLGPRVCLDKACADRLQEVLLGTAASKLQAIVLELVKSGISWASLFQGAGSWVGLALLHFAAHWGLSISLNKTSNGVCLTFLFAWWRPFTLGIINGYAQGR